MQHVNEKSRNKKTWHQIYVFDIWRHFGWVMLDYDEKKLFTRNWSPSQHTNVHVKFWAWRKLPHIQTKKLSNEAWLSARKVSLDKKYHFLNSLSNENKFTKLNMWVIIREMNYGPWPNITKFPVTWINTTITKNINARICKSKKRFKVR